MQLGDQGELYPDMKPSYSGKRASAFFRYPGGKRKLAAPILERLRPMSACRRRLKEYCEPFCGGASIGIEYTKKYGRHTKIILDAELIGLCGEHAAGQSLGANRTPSLKPMPPGGKPYDFLGPPPLNYRMDVKTTTFAKAKEGLIRAVNDFGKPRMLTCQIYIFATLLDSVWEALKHREKVRVLINGWIRRDEIPSELRPARTERGKHYNLEVPYEMLRPMSELLALCGIPNRYESTIKTYRLSEDD